jgi:hypothetical protein
MTGRKCEVVTWSMVSLGIALVAISLLLTPASASAQSPLGIQSCNLCNTGCTQRTPPVQSCDGPYCTQLLSQCPNCPCTQYIGTDGKPHCHCQFNGGG